MTTNRLIPVLILLSFVVLGASPAAAQTATLPATMSFRPIDSVTVPFQNSIPVPSFEPQRRPTIDLSGTWRKSRFAANHNVSLAARDSAGYAALLAEAGGKHLVAFNDSAWATKTLPGVENQLNGNEVIPETYEDGVWYRRTFTVPDSLKGRTALLKFLAVNYVTDVWLNGTYLGWHEGGYTSFAFDISSAVRTDTVNVLAVRVDNPPWNPIQTASGNWRIDIVPYYRCDWFNYTGVIHDVLVEFADSVFIPRVDVVPLDTLGTLKVGVSVWNRGNAQQSVDIGIQVSEAVIDSANFETPYPSDLFNSPVALGGNAQNSIVVAADSVRGWKTQVKVPQAKLWTPKAPRLYIMRVTLSQNGKVLDRFDTQFGIRTVQTSGARLLLNGRTVYLPGVARHEDHPSYGRSIPRSVIASDLKLLKSLNTAFVRTAHYPNHPFTYVMADRIGLTVLEEIPVWWFDTDQAWTIQNSTRHIHTQMFREMVFRDFNRPSIIFWSTCNECLAIAGRLQFISAINTELDTQYPDGRLVTESAAADRPGPTDLTQSACDVAGWTMYFGIFHGSTYFDGTLVFVRSAHAAFPNKPIIDTEFGYWSNTTGSAQPKQMTVLDSTFKAFGAYVSVLPNGKVNPYGCVAATTWWCAFDWYTCQQSTYNTFGLYHMDRTTPKSVAAAFADTCSHYYANLMTLGVEEPSMSNLPASFALNQNYPNPFNPSTNVSYTVPEASEVRVAIFDILGREVLVLVNGHQAAGTYSVRLDGAALSSGVYFCRLSAGSFRDVKKMLLLK